MTPDELTRQEEANRDLIKALGQLSQHGQPPPDFLDRVMARAVPLPPPHRWWFAWFPRVPAWPSPMTVRVALALTFVLALVGAVPQYITWINTYVLEEPPDVVYQARVQEQLWKKNFACATEIDRSSSNYAELDGEQVVVVTWTCPSGDVLLTVESPKDESFRRLIWIPLSTRRQMTYHFPWFVREAMAADGWLVVSQSAAQIAGVLCQRWLPNRLIKRRVQLANGRCVDETVNPRTGRVVTRQDAPCDRSC
jgi:hypothetical protein